MKLTILATVLLLGGCFPKNWRTQDALMEDGVAIMTTVDWTQTLTITEHCEEANPVIGKCGGRVNPTLYFAAFLVLQGVVTRLLPPTWRGPLQGALIGAEAATVWDNKFGD